MTDPRSSRFEQPDPRHAWFDLCRGCDVTERAQLPIAHDIRNTVQRMATVVTDAMTSAGVVAGSPAQQDAIIDLQVALYTYARTSLRDQADLSTIFAAEAIGVMQAASEGIDLAKHGIRLETRPPSTVSK